MGMACGGRRGELHNGAMGLRAARSSTVWLFDGMGHLQPIPGGVSMMRCVVYVAGRIVKYRDGSRKQCEQYLLAVVDGLEAAGCRLALEEHQGMWHGYTTFGKPVLAFVWNPNRRNA